MYVEADNAHSLRAHQLHQGLSLPALREMLLAIEALTKLAREVEKLAKFNARHERLPPLWQRRDPGRQLSVQLIVRRGVRLKRTFRLLIPPAGNPVEVATASQLRTGIVLLSEVFTTENTLAFARYSANGA